MNGPDLQGMSIRFGTMPSSPIAQARLGLASPGHLILRQPRNGPDR
jgi:hypothetical protein